MRLALLPLPLQSFAYKCLGMVMLKSSHKEFVQDHLSVIFSSVNHASQEEREVGGARGVVGSGRDVQIGLVRTWGGADGRCPLSGVTPYNFTTCIYPWTMLLHASTHSLLHLSPSLTPGEFTYVRAVHVIA